MMKISGGGGGEGGRVVKIFFITNIYLKSVCVN